MRVAAPADVHDVPLLTRLQLYIITDPNGLGEQHVNAGKKVGQGVLKSECDRQPSYAQGGHQGRDVDAQESECECHAQCDNNEFDEDHCETGRRERDLVREMMEGLSGDVSGHEAHRQDNESAKEFVRIVDDLRVGFGGANRDMDGDDDAPEQRGPPASM